MYEQVFGYMAVDARCSGGHEKAITKGLSKDEPYFELQRDDELNEFESDMEAIIHALGSAMKGDVYAIKTLRIAVTDLLVLNVAAGCVL
jgi:hypothetical protein